MIRRLLGTAVLALGLTLAACGQDISNNYGTLKLTIAGLPTGAKGAIKVKGTGFEKTFDASSNISLLAGTYTVTGTAIKVANEDYDVAIDLPTVAIAQKGESTVKATYSKASTLTITISGLPSGIDAGVLVKSKGSDAFSETVNATKTLTFVKPGDYDISAALVTSGADKYGASITPETVTVGVGEAKESTVSFSKIDTTVKGSINLSASGLNAATSPNMTVTGPNGFLQIVSTSAITKLEGLAIGDYTITSKEVDSSTFPTDNLVFIPTEKTKTVAVINADPVDIVINHTEEFSYASFNAVINSLGNNLKQGGYVYTFAGPAVGSKASFTRDLETATITYTNNDYYGFDLRPFVTSDGLQAVPIDLTGYTKMKLKLAAIENVTSITITMMSNPNDAENFKDAQFNVTDVTSSLQEKTLELSQFLPRPGGVAIADALKSLRQIRVQGNQPSGNSGKYQVSSISFIK
jgi:hypothetical protein